MNPEELKRIAVLQALDSEALTRLTTALDELEPADGQVVFAEGDPGDSMFFIVRGAIRIEKRAQVAQAARKTLGVYEAGDYFGEMALFDEKPRPATAVSAGGARLLRLSKAAFDQILQTNSQAALSVLFAMLRTAGERIRRLSTMVIVYDEVGRAIGEAGDLQMLLNVILQQLSTATSADWGLLLLRSQFSERLDLRGELNLTLTAAQREAISNGQGFLRPLLRKPQDRLVLSSDEDELFQSCPRLGFETASLLLCPIMSEAQFLGLIALGGNEANQFDLTMLNLVRGVARQATQAILNARHREEEQARSRHSRQFVRF
jgi:CRP-like cAMP-binding protein